MSAVDLAILAALVCSSAFLSGSEIALFSLSRFQLRALKERYRSSHRGAKRLLADPGGLLITILLLNETCSVLISARVAGALSRNHSVFAERFAWFPEFALDSVLGLLITTPIILMLCEITPKVVAARMNTLITLATVRPLGLIYDLLKPARFILGHVLRLLTGGSVKVAERERTQQALLKESEFLLMMEEGHKEGAIQESELELIKNVFELDDTSSADIATPVSRVHTLSKSTTLKGALAAYRAHRFSRIPIVTGAKKKIVGVVYAKDLLKARLQPELLSESVETIMRAPLTVSKNLPLNALFRRFKQQKTHMAIVENDAGDSIGIVTMHDVLDVLIDDLLPDAPVATPVPRSTL